MVISGYLDHQSTQFRLSANELLKTLVKYMAIIAGDSAKEACLPKENKISTSFGRCKILNCLLEKHITMPPVREITLERMTDTRKP